MATSSTEQLITWLNSAYSMEQTLEHVLENHVKDSEEFPDLQARTEQHLQETRRHAERIQYCLGLLNEKPSTTKSLIGNVMGMVQGPSTGMYKDELVKNVLSDYAAEHFEIACYRSLIAAAHACGQPQIAEVCREILQDEEEMALWLQDRIPQVTTTYLTLHTARA